MKHEPARPVRPRVFRAALASVLLAAAPVVSAQMTVSVSALDAFAGETPPDNGTFLVSGSGFASGPVRVSYAVSGSASAGADYTALPGEVTLAFDGLWQATLAVEVSGDDQVFEGEETVTIELLAAEVIGGGGESIAVSSIPATVTIADSSHSVTVSATGDASESPLSAGEFVVSLGGRNESGAAVNVGYTVAGTATAGTDYESLSGTASIPNGESSASIDVTPLDDDVQEDAETVQVTLSSVDAVGVSVGTPNTASLSIADGQADGDVVVSVVADDESAGETPPDDARFTIRRDGGSSRAVTVGYTVGGTATPDDDYGRLSGSARLEEGESAVSIAVDVPGNDDRFEGDETVTISLNDGDGITVATREAAVTIADSPHSVTAERVSDATENPAGIGQLRATLGAQNASGSTLTVQYTVGGTATPGTDYETLSGTADIALGSSSATIDVTPLDDDLFEDDETVEITLTATNDPRASVGAPATASLAIVDDDSGDDDDGDGVPNGVECPVPSQCRDTDGDALPDYRDPDDDGDGVPTASENPPGQDTDGNGTPDFLDDDDDGDGVPTATEDANEDGDGDPSTNPGDTDGDGIPDYLDGDDTGGPAGDVDGDGLSNEREAELGTDPRLADTDGDGVGDGDEATAGSDPLDRLSFEDMDGDLVPDAVEAADGTDPGDLNSFADGDGGGTADHIEIVTYPSFGLDPADALDPADDGRDSDGDGVPDRLEIFSGSDAASAESPAAGGAGDDDGNGLSNAVEAYLESLGIGRGIAVGAASDFDRDGYPDGTEVSLGLNPLSGTERDADGDGVPDIVEARAGLDIDAATDSDGDAVPDAREIALAADPLDANSPVANGGLDDDGDGVSNAIEHVLETFYGASGVDNGSDGDEDGIPDADEIRFGTDPARDEQPVPWIELIQADVGPVSALSTAGGGARATAMIGGHQNGTLLYDWAGSDNAVLAVVDGTQTGKTLAFSPQTLPPGPYNLVVRVERAVGDYRSDASIVEFPFNVLADATAGAIADGDGDGIVDSSDAADARKGYANELRARGGATLEATPGVRLQLGTTARIAGASSALVTRNDIAGAGDGRGGAVGNSEDDFDYLGGIYNFEITNLPEAGSMIQIVIPQTAAIGEFPEYRKYLAGRGWSNFVEDESNAVESAAGGGGSCPAPGDSAWQPGLTPGHRCVQLTLEDGGPNDGDAAEGPNGVIRDPGGVGTPRGEVSVGQGSGSFSPALLVVLALFGITAARRARAPAGIVLPALLITLLAAPPAALADAFVGVGVGASFLDPATAGSPFRIEDDQDTGMKLFAGFDLTPVSRNLSVEAFWADLGSATLSGNGAVDYSLYGAGLSYGIGSVSMPRLSGFVEAGVVRLDTSANVPLTQEDDTLMFFGLAGSFAIRRHWFLQLEYEYFAEDAQMISLSVVKRFRTRTASDARTMPLPED